MPGLALKLAPNEQVLINGVVVENGPRRTQLLIRTDNAAILRLREALGQDEVVGPASRAYYAAQQCVAGFVPPCEATKTLTPMLADLRALPQAAETVANVERQIASGNYYRVMRALRPLLDREKAQRAAAE